MSERAQPPGASQTARAVAAHRLGCERIETQYGDPEADRRLSEDVVAGLAIDHTSGLSRYLRGRTRVFDRVVTRAIERGNRQIVVLGAGYDLRSLRYGAEGVRFFEVDHPVTQADKLARMARLKIDHGTVKFVAADFNSDAVDELLLSAGFALEEPTLFYCEGVTAYLPVKTAARLFAAVRSLAMGGTRLAVSGRVPGASPERRAALAEHAAAVGEPFLFGDADLGEVLESERWELVTVPDAAARVGLLTARPFWRAGTPATRSILGRYFEETFYNDPVDRLATHVAAENGVQIDGAKQITGGAFSIRLADGRVWIARVLPRGADIVAAKRAATAMQYAARNEIPAERPAGEHPCTLFGERPVLLSAAVEGSALSESVGSAHLLGDLLGRMHACADPPPAVGGAWHYLATSGGPEAEVDRIRELAAVRGGLPSMVSEELDGAAETIAVISRLPVAFSHADLVRANVLVRDEGFTIIDWLGAGMMPRVWALGYLLSTIGGPKSIAATLAAYRTQIEPTAAEWEQLPAAIGARAAILELWALVCGRSPRDAVTVRDERWRRVDEIVKSALAARWGN